MEKTGNPYTSHLFELLSHEMLYEPLAQKVAKIPELNDWKMEKTGKVAQNPQLNDWKFSKNGNLFRKC